jgi:hypothetical protein
VLLSNPSAFKVNDVTIALSTTDAVSDVATEEISKSKSGIRLGNRVQRGELLCCFGDGGVSFCSPASTHEC